MPLTKFDSYLKRQVPTDTTSFWVSTKLNALGSSWSAGGNPLPDGTMKAADTETPVITNPFSETIKQGQGNIKVLTTSKLGDWYGPMKDIDYPVQIIDAIRDLTLNIFWQDNADSKELGLWISGLHKALSDDLLSGTSFANDFVASPKPFVDLKINPTAWASRYARANSISIAKNSVIISQQMLVNSLMMDNGDYQGLVQKVNSTLDLNKPTDKWDGFLWPFGKSLFQRT